MTEKEELLNEETIDTTAQEETSAQEPAEATTEQTEETPAEEPRELTVEEKLAEAEAKIEKLNNAMLYKVAEFEKIMNTSKNLLKQQETSLIIYILGIITKLGSGKMMP